MANKKNINYVWKNLQTGKCSVYPTNPGGYNEMYGPASWEDCWKWIEKYCKQKEGN